MAEFQRELACLMLLAQVAVPAFGASCLTFESETSYYRDGMFHDKEVDDSYIWIGKACMAVESASELMAIFPDTETVFLLNKTERTFQRFDVAGDLSRYVSPEQIQKHSRFMNLYSPIIEITRAKEEKQFNRWKSSERIHVDVTSVLFGAHTVVDYWNAPLPVDMEVFARASEIRRLFLQPDTIWLNKKGKVAGIPLYTEMTQEQPKYKVVTKARLVDLSEEADVDGTKCLIPEGFTEEPADYTRFFAK